MLGKHSAKAALRVLDCSGGASGDDLGRPVPRQKFVDALGGLVGQPPQDVGKPGAGIDFVELDEVDGLPLPAS